ncbi:MAG: VCBS repeat-containing protein [Sandaracinaceae bacterium]|nr:VCBS repeat-containing protein [Sandaracinaceae bacterium]MBK8408084.1 VCBS repeat-containing protein [Sandaracinaceae bacterium]
MVFVVLVASGHVTGCGGSTPQLEPDSGTVDSSVDGGVDASVVLDPCTSNRDCQGGEVCRSEFCRTACGGPSDCIGALSVCDEVLGYCVECVGHGDCGANEACTGSVCTFFCREHAACGDDDFCVFDTGACAPRECESTSECAGGYQCDDFVCVSIDDLVCEAGEQRCSPDGREALRCNADGTMEAMEGCDAGATCVLASGQTACLEVVCVSDEVGCVDAATRFVCDASGTLRTDTGCGSDAYCEGGSCHTRVCTPSTVRCASGGREICNALGSAYEAAPCGGAQECVDGTCVDRVCANGTSRCVANTLTGREVCAPNGLAWQSMPCDGTQTCSAGVCMSRICAPSVSECASGTSSRVCLASGLGYSTTMSCPGGQSCTSATGQCESWVCTPGTTSCDSDATRRVCNADGLGYTTTACGASQSCNAGTCQAWLCTPGAFSCVDASTRRVCNANGLGYTAAACAGNNAFGYSCSAGNCVARVCTPGTPDTVCGSTTARRVCNADGSGFSTVGCAAGQSCASGACAVRCGDGIVGGSEECDDANMVDDDECSNACEVTGLCELTALASFESIRPYAASWGDVDGDGRDDLATSTGNATALQVLVRGSGNTLNAAWSEPESGLEARPAWGDFDGDGDPDLAIGHTDRPQQGYTGFASLYRNDGGTLVDTTWRWQGVPGVLGPIVTGLTWGRINGDSRDDLFMASAHVGPLVGSSRNRIYFGASTALSTTPSWSASPPSIANWIHEASVVDLDGDGDGDLVASYRMQAIHGNTAGFSVMRQHPANTFAAWPNAPVSSQLNAHHAAGDLDGDGDVDLVLVSGSTVRSYLNDGTGALTLVASFSHSSTNVPELSANNRQQRIPISLGDFDDDGVLDLALIRWSDTDLILRGVGDGTFIAQWSTPESESHNIGSWIDWDGDGQRDEWAVSGESARLRVYGCR